MNFAQLRGPPFLADLRSGAAQKHVAEKVEQRAVQLPGPTMGALQRPLDVAAIAVVHGTLPCREFLVPASIAVAGGVSRNGVAVAHDAAREGEAWRITFHEPLRLDVDDRVTIG